MSFRCKLSVMAPCTDQQIGPHAAVTEHTGSLFLHSLPQPAAEGSTVGFVQETVREAAGKLARTLQGLTVRLADVSQTPAAQAAAVAALALPLLLSKGLSSSVGGVQVSELYLSVDCGMLMVQSTTPWQACHNDGH